MNRNFVGSEKNIFVYFAFNKKKLKKKSNTNFFLSIWKNRTLKSQSISFFICHEISKNNK